jgi:hypothetical protein
MSLAAAPKDTQVTASASVTRLRCWGIDVRRPRLLGAGAIKKDKASLDKEALDYGCHCTNDRCESKSTEKRSDLCAEPRLWRDLANCQS